MFNDPATRREQWESPPEYAFSRPSPLSPPRTPRSLHERRGFEYHYIALIEELSQVVVGSTLSYAACALSALVDGAYRHPFCPVLRYLLPACGAQCCWAAHFHTKPKARGAIPVRQALVATAVVGAPLVNIMSARTASSRSRDTKHQLQLGVALLGVIT